MKSEECFYVKENRLDFVFLTLFVSHKSQVFLNSIRLAKIFFLKVRFPLCASNFDSKNKLKSPAITSSFVGFLSNSSNSSNKILNTSICSFLALCRFIKIYSQSLMKASRIKIRPFLYACRFLTINAPLRK